MSTFVSEKCNSRAALVFLLPFEENAAESRRILVEAYGQHALDISQCFEWFNKFKSAEFDVRNKNPRKSLNMPNFKYY